MQPDYDRAATQAAQMLIDYGVTSGPVDPMSILQSLPNALLITFTDLSGRLDEDRDQLVSAFGAINQDAVTIVKESDGQLFYCIAYNMRLPYFMVQRGLARELGHIVLGHDGSRTNEVRKAEALAFAYHLLCPRPLVRALQDCGITLTAEMVGNITGCYERCLRGMAKTPGVHVPPTLNRAVRAQFDDYAREFARYQLALYADDDSPVVDFGTYMDGYEE